MKTAELYPINPKGEGKIAARDSRMNWTRSFRIVLDARRFSVAGSFGKLQLAFSRNVLRTEVLSSEGVVILKTFISVRTSVTVLNNPEYRV